MKKRTKALIPVAILALVIAVLAFNPIYAFRIYQPQSCTVTNLPAHFLVIRYATFENWTNSQPVAEGEYVICPSHPDSKAYGCRTTECYGDNGTCILTGQRYTLYDGSYHDNTEWELKSNYIGVLVSDTTTPLVQQLVILASLLIIILVVFTPIVLYYVWKPATNADENSRSDTP
jgi:hypothetical protein